MVAELNVERIAQSCFGAICPKKAKCPVFNLSLMVVDKKVVSTLWDIKNGVIADLIGFCLRALANEYSVDFRKGNKFQNSRKW